VGRALIKEAAIKEAAPMPSPPQKPTRTYLLLTSFTWALSYLIYTGFYLLYTAVVHRTITRQNLAAAFVAGFVFATVAGFLQWRRLRKDQQIPTN